MPQKILVTGGAGYLGSILVPDLIAAGHSVTVLDNFMFDQNSLASVCSEPNFDLIRGDIRDESTMKSALSDKDIVIPLAAYVGAPICKADPVGATSTNLDAILMMLELIGDSQKVLMPTTNSAYGSGDKNNFCTEESPLNPISNYAQDKVKVEAALMNHQNFISFRLATVFGMSPRMRLDLLVNDFTYRAVKDRYVVLFEGGFKRNYVHVRDVSRVFQHGINNFDSMRNQIFNVGLSDANLSKTELCEKIQTHIPDFHFFHAELGKDPDQRNYVVSNDKLAAQGFKPMFSIDDGILELIKGYQMIKNSKYGNV